MTSGELAIVIAGTREDWPGGARTLTPRESTREPNGTLWFGAELDPDGDQVLVPHQRGRRRPDAGGDARRPRSPPGRRPHRLDHAGPPARSPTSTASRSGISAAGDGWLERLGWRRWIPSRPPPPAAAELRAPFPVPWSTPLLPPSARRTERGPSHATRWPRRSGPRSAPGLPCCPDQASTRPSRGRRAALSAASL